MRSYLHESLNHSDEFVIRDQTVFVGRAAIDRNLEILLRAARSETKVAEGDRCEIVHFVGGE